MAAVPLARENFNLLDSAADAGAGSDSIAVAQYSSSSAGAASRGKHSMYNRTSLPLAALISMSTASTASEDIAKLDQDSDEDVFTVPVVEAQEARVVDLVKPTESMQQGSGSCPDSGKAKRKRGRHPIDKENRRLKRLLRNRVSAQQARERKKEYVNELEYRGKELEEKNLMLEEKISTLVNENSMLRKILLNIRPKGDHDEET